MNLSKIFICLICLLLSFSTVSAKEIETLYVIKKVPKENLANVINNYLSQTDYNVVSRNDYYILPAKSKNSNDFYGILLDQNGQDCYLYYLSNNDKSDLHLLLSKEIKKGHLSIKKIKAPKVSSVFKQKAFSLKENAEKSTYKAQNYSFDDDAQSAFSKKNSTEPAITQTKTVNLKGSSSNAIPTASKQPKQTPIIASAKPSSQKVLKGSVITVPNGTTFSVTMQSGISSASLAKSDRITAVLNEDLRYNGFLVLPAGTILYGSAIKAKAASYAYGNGNLELTFDQALTPNGQKMNISVDKISYIKNSTRAVNIVKNVAVGTGLGILGGLLSAASTGDYANAVLIGASVGAAGGGIYAAAQKGEEIELPEGTKLNLRINQPINISPYN